MRDPATTAREELAHIRSLMEDGQRFLCGTWRHQLLWGVLSLAGLAATWLAAGRGWIAVIWWIWPVVLLVGWAGSLRLGSRRQAPPVRNVAGRAFAGIWVGLGVTLTLLGTLAVWAGALDPRALPGVLALVFGLGYFASGHLSGLGWLTAVGLFWWAGGGVLLFWRGSGALLGLAALVLVLEIGPALALRRLERDPARS